MTMTTLTDADVDELRALLREFLKRHAETEPDHETTGVGVDSGEALWRRLIDELGVVALTVPEHWGGGGYPWSLQLVVFEELGRSLARVPYLSTVGLALPVLIASGDAAVQDDLIPQIVSGAKTATVAFVDADADWTASRCVLTATSEAEGGSVSLNGSTAYVIDGCSADVVLTLAQGTDGVGLYAVEGGAAGLTRSPMRALDPTRGLARLVFDDVSARRVGPSDDGRRIIDAAMNFAHAAIAAEQLGGAAFCLEESVEYARVREQFGRPIGGFQAIKHHCADMLITVESARSAVAYAADAMTDDPEEFPVAAAVAKAYCSEAFLNVADGCIHVHGGIGFTWEHFAHRYFRRAQSMALLHGDGAHHRQRVADLLGF
ncbi:acyl-CoA dehydrogenase family protein [Mycobacterium syngnathidarum]